MGILSKLMERDGKSTTKMFSVLCQNPKCKAHLGGVHFCSDKGVAYFTCQKCNSVTGVENTEAGHELALIKPS